MDLRQGKIRNLNKKLIAGALGITILSSAIVGCSVSNRIKLGRQRYENFVGVASFEKMRKCYFLEIYNKQEETTKYYIADKYEILNKDEKTLGFVYLDLLESKNIFVDRLDNCSSGFEFVEDHNKTLVNELNMEEYLYSFREIKPMYSAEDIKNLIEQMKQISLNKTK